VSARRRTGTRAGAEVGAGAGVGAGASVTAVVGPDAVETFPRMIRVGAGWAATLIVTGYPAEVRLAWLDTLLRGSVRLDATLHIEPLPAPPLPCRATRKPRPLIPARTY
jgi:hypothetical protein